MKKYAIIGFVLAVFVFTSCAEKGGTIEVENYSEYTAKITILRGWVPLKIVKDGSIAPGKTDPFHLDENDFYQVRADFYDGYSNRGFDTVFPQYVSDGDTVKVTISPR
jgi:hypothetical protein